MIKKLKKPLFLKNKGCVLSDEMWLNLFEKFFSGNKQSSYYNMNIKVIYPHISRLAHISSLVFGPI